MQVASSQMGLPAHRACSEPVSSTRAWSLLGKFTSPPRKKKTAPASRSPAPHFANKNSFLFLSFGASRHFQKIALKCSEVWDCNNHCPTGGGRGTSSSETDTRHCANIAATAVFLFERKICGLQIQLIPSPKTVTLTHYTKP